jgi:carboxymethylenebutenolidase
MCELDQLNTMRGMNRRQFTAIGAFAAFATACAPMESATAQGGLVEEMVSFPAPGGTMDAFFVHPGEGEHPAVIIWPDIAGLRDAFKVMGRRLASAGYSVLVVNPYYRDLPAPQFEDFEDFRANEGFQKVGPWREKMNADGVMETARAVVGWLDQQPSVDTAKGIGNQGYCMGGPYTIWTAAAVPARVKAGASFHGGGLVGEDPQAPVHLFDEVADDAQFLIAIAQNDDEKSPTDKDTLREAAQAAGVEAEIEVYAGDHGWTVPDSPVYAEAAAERAWERLLALYSSAL